MNRLIQLKTATPPLLITLTLLCSGLLPGAQAVVPPPDGGYPNFNTAEGQNALFSLTTGAANTAVGWFSLKSNAEGNFNTATGAGALLFNTANENTAFGAAALLFNTIGFDNTAVGDSALFSNTSGLANTAVGADALLSNTQGGTNTAIGHLALFSNTTGASNTAVGVSALASNTIGEDNTAVGAHALANSTGNFNTALGIDAGFNATTGSNNLYVGSGMMGVAGESNACYIASIFGQTSAAGIPVLINSNNKLGTITSSKRFKEDIKPMDKASEALFSLNPVSFRYRKEIDPAGTSQLGLVAEDVDKVNPALVVRDKEGKPYSVRYDQVNAMLLNEFLKEHRKNEEQEATIARQQKQIEALAVGLHKVNAQLIKAAKYTSH